MDLMEIARTESRMENQRVVVIQDASGGPKTSALRWALRGLSLKPGDKLTLLALVLFVHNPSKQKIVTNFTLLQS